MKAHSFFLVFVLFLAGTFTACDNNKEDEPASLRVVNAIPGVSSLDLTADLNPIALDLRYKEASLYTRKDPGLYLLEALTIQNNAEQRVSRQVLLSSELAYTLLVTGFEDPARLLLLEDDRSAPPSGSARIRVVHAAPAVADIQVAIEASDTGNLLLASSTLSFGEPTTDTSLAAGTVDIVVETSAGSSTLANQELLPGRLYLVVFTNLTGAPMFMLVDN